MFELEMDLRERRAKRLTEPKQVKPGVRTWIDPETKTRFRETRDRYGNIVSKQYWLPEERRRPTATETEATLKEEKAAATSGVTYDRGTNRFEPELDEHGYMTTEAERAARQNRDMRVDFEDAGYMEMTREQADKEHDRLMTHWQRFMNKHERLLRREGPIPAREMAIWNIVGLTMPVDDAGVERPEKLKITGPIKKALEDFAELDPKGNWTNLQWTPNIEDIDRLQKAIKNKYYPEPAELPVPEGAEIAVPEAGRPIPEREEALPTTGDYVIEQIEATGEAVPEEQRIAIKKILNTLPETMSFEEVQEMAAAKYSGMTSDQFIEAVANAGIELTEEERTYIVNIWPEL